MSIGLFGKFYKVLNDLIDNGTWDKNDELEVKVGGSLPKDKFIVIQNKTKRGEKK